MRGVLVREEVEEGRYVLRMKLKSEGVELSSCTCLVQRHLARAFY